MRCASLMSSLLLKEYTSRYPQGALSELPAVAAGDLRRANHGFMVRPCLIALAGLAAALVTECTAQLPSKQAAVSANANASLRAFLQVFDTGLEDHIVAAIADLNGDGRREAVVYLTSKHWCGSGGCTTLILVRDDDYWRLLSKIPITRPPIRLLRTKSNGWRNIGVWVQGGGIQPGYEAELRFDGKTYPANPSMPRARPLKGKTEGEMLIGLP